MLLVRSLHTGPDPQSLWRLGVLPPNPRLWYVWGTLAFSTRLQSLIFALFNYYLKPSPFVKFGLSANRQRFQIFHPMISLSHKKFLFWKFLMTSLHVICGLGPLPIKNSHQAYKLEIAWKTFLKTFFFGEHLRLCPWPWLRAFLSLASRGSVLEKAVLGLGLGFFMCPWP